MAWNETKATLTGRICTDVRVYNANDEDRMVATFIVVTSERRFDKETNGWVRGRELFMRVKCFRRLAGAVAETFVKGDPVVVTGKLCTNKWEKEGQTRSDLELEASAIGPDLTFCKIALLRDERSGMPIETVAA